PGEIDKAWRARARPADGVDEREVLLDEIIADHGFDGRIVPSAERTNGEFQLRRPHVVCRRVDQVAAEPYALDGSHGLLRISRLGEDEHRAFATTIGLVSAVSVGAETPCDDRHGRIAGGGTTETVGARRELRRKRPDERRRGDGSTGPV